MFFWQKKKKNRSINPAESPSYRFSEAPKNQSKQGMVIYYAHARGALNMYVAHNARPTTISPPYPIFHPFPPSPPLSLYPITIFRSISTVRVSMRGRRHSSKLDPSPSGEPPSPPANSSNEEEGMKPSGLPPMMMTTKASIWRAPSSPSGELPTTRSFGNQVSSF